MLVRMREKVLKMDIESEYTLGSYTSLKKKFQTAVVMHF